MRQIKTTINNTCSSLNFKLFGWYDGKQTFIGFADRICDNDICHGTLSGQKLYRLAKTIVKEFENDTNTCSKTN